MAKTYGLGFIESPLDDRDWILPLEAPSEPIPLDYNAHNKAGGLLPILNQGKTPQCVAFASSTMKTYQEKLDAGKYLSFDTGWLYKECKRIDGHPDVQGTTVRAAMKVLKNKGVPLANRLGIGADRHKIAAYYSVPKDVHNIKLAIMQYGPIVVGSIWFESWFKPVDGVLPPPDKKAGGHCTEYHGWDDRIKTPVGYGGLIGQNSWSEKYGLKGKFIIPYEYVKYLSEIFKAVDVIDDEDEITKSYIARTYSNPS